MELSPIAKLNPSEILSRLGSGGMDEVFKAPGTRFARTGTAP
jgi:hypothetical protein